jgi:hypothetical protein
MLFDNLYARGVAVYGDIKNGANDHGEIIKKHRNDVNVVYRDVFSCMAKRCVPIPCNTA